jgi:hypothetical protein
VDIAAHLELHDSAIRAWAYTNVYGDFRQDAEQNIRLAMFEAHERGWYDHNAGELFTYVFPYLRGIAFKGLLPKEEWLYEHFADPDDEEEERGGLVVLEEWAQEQGVTGSTLNRSTTRP